MGVLCARVCACLFERGKEEEQEMSLPECVGSGIVDVFVGIEGPDHVAIDLHLVPHSAGVGYCSRHHSHCTAV